MSLFTKREIFGPSAGELIPARSANSSSVAVNNDTALRHGAVWACLRLRANTISTLPVDVFRRELGVQVEVAKPKVLVTPDGRVPLHEWLYSSQFDLDRAGNVFGIITARDSRGAPAEIVLQPLSDVSVQVRDGKVTYRIGRSEYTPDEVWHERQYTVPGLPVGLSPVAYAAWTISEYLSVQQFARDWFAGGATPSAHLKNTAKTLTPAEATQIKDRYTTSVAHGDVFVTGNDWEYEMMGAQAADQSWLAAMKASASDVARFFDCPADLIDAETSTGSITYANVTQRNLQFLVLHLGPAIVRREWALSRLVHGNKYVKLNEKALLRMDPASRAEMNKTLIEQRALTPDEARAQDERRPLSEGQYGEFDRLFGAPRTQPTGATA